MDKIYPICICFLHLYLASCHAQVPGCTDPLANNYDPSATINDGSCTYDPFSVSPGHTVELSEILSETSGLILWDGLIWTHNDNTDTKLYGLDTISGNIIKEYDLQQVENTDWEEIGQDDEYIYVGDLGNNAGRREDLHLLRIHKTSLITGEPLIDTVWFSYSDQPEPGQDEPYETDFDCEAFVVSEDSIYLFTKQWLSANTSVYTLPKVPGSYVAQIKESYDIQGLITGATYLESKGVLVLCGYTSLLHPFLYLLYDFVKNDFFSGNKRKITISLPFHQVEGIATRNGLKYLISNESFIFQPAANNPQKLHTFDLEDLLGDYFARNADLVVEPDTEEIKIYPNPAAHYVMIKSPIDLLPSDYQLIDMSSRVMKEGMLEKEYTQLDISRVKPGSYILRIERSGGNTISLLSVKF